MCNNFLLVKFSFDTTAKLIFVAHDSFIGEKSEDKSQEKCPYLFNIFTIEIDISPVSPKIGYENTSQVILNKHGHFQVTPYYICHSQFDCFCSILQIFWADERFSSVRHWSLVRFEDSSWCVRVFKMSAFRFKVTQLELECTCSVSRVPAV